MQKLAGTGQPLYTVVSKEEKQSQASRLAFFICGRGETRKLVLDIETGAAILTVVSKKHDIFRVLVDTEDWERVNARTWSAAKNERGHVYFVTKILKVDGKQTQMYLHRFLMNVTDTNVLVDHVHHNYLDNRKSQLRGCSNEENSRNSRKGRRNSSGFKGVYWEKTKGKYRAQIVVNGKPKHLGYFDCPIECARRYDVAAIEYFGEFALLNFPLSDYITATA